MNQFPPNQMPPPPVFAPPQQTEVGGGTPIPVVLASLVGTIAGIFLCASSFMKWVTAEIVGYGSFSGNGWDDLDADMSWGPLISLWGIIIAISFALALVGYSGVKAGRTATLVALLALGMASWQWSTITRLSADTTAEVAFGLYVWIASGVVALVCGIVVSVSSYKEKNPSNLGTYST